MRWYGTVGALDEPVQTRLQAATHILISTPRAKPVTLHSPARAPTNRCKIRYSMARLPIDDRRLRGYGRALGRRDRAAQPIKPALATSSRCRSAVDVAILRFRHTGACDRLAGIYGPGPLAVQSDSISPSEAKINKPGHAFSRIHVDDIARILAKIHCQSKTRCCLQRVR